MATVKTPDRRPERSSDRRHREIREAAIGIFLANGYEGTTMEEIAVRAGVSKQTVYKHFTDKQHLFADIVLSTTDDMSALVGIIAERLPADHRPRRRPGAPGRDVPRAL